MSASQEKVKALLGDLGKATLRGIRRCPKCGTFNGTRGIACKNKTCGKVFKERDKRKIASADAVRIITGSTAQVFSVRLRDRGPDYRGFVQLPIIDDIHGTLPAVVEQHSRCFVDSCKMVDYNQSQLVSHVCCPHIKAAMESTIEDSIELMLKDTVLNSTLLPPDLKQEIWMLATDTTGPMVQRVSKSVFVVKCKPTTSNPLGFLHFSFYETCRNRLRPEYKYQCSCKSFKTYKPPMGKLCGPTNFRRCVHFYACICAFASDGKLFEEFTHYINMNETVILELEEYKEVHQEVQQDEQELPDDEPLPDDSPLLAEDVANSTEFEVYVMDDAFLAAAEEVPVPPKRTRHDDSLSEVNKVILALQENQTSPKRLQPPKPPPPKPPPPKPVSKPVTRQMEEEMTILTFHQWLGNVTERINQTMHYQFNGYPEPLVFHAPQEFFDCLQQRINSGNRKKRLPNSTTAFVRKDALPLGTFTKYTWLLTDIGLVKNIFDTPQMPLEVIRSFVQNHDSTFDVYDAPEVDTENMGENSKPIRPFELKTFLKVGCMMNATDGKEVTTPFTIEWIPDILPKSRIGELRLKFQYGHQRNGTPELRYQTHVTKVPRNIHPLSVPQNIHPITASQNIHPVNLSQNVLHDHSLGRNVQDTNVITNIHDVNNIITRSVQNATQDILNAHHTGHNITIAQDIHDTHNIQNIHDSHDISQNIHDTHDISQNIHDTHDISQNIHESHSISQNIHGAQNMQDAGITLSSHITQHVSDANLTMHISDSNVDAMAYTDKTDAMTPDAICMNAINLMVSYTCIMVLAFSVFHQ